MMMDEDHDDDYQDQNKKLSGTERTAAKYADHV
jgi:hypothetical protein